MHVPLHRKIESGDPASGLDLPQEKFLTGWHGHETAVRIEGMKAMPQRMVEEEHSDDEDDQQLWRLFRSS